jgi:Phosphoglucomutase/phosphomannomutase, alpha/beta/alpha domain III.
MLRNDSQAGGEGSSGGFILPEFNYCREGILTSGLISSMLENTEFSEILTIWKVIFKLEKNGN